MIWAFLTFAGGLCRLFMSVPAMKSMRVSRDLLAPTLFPARSRTAERIIWGLNFFPYEDTASRLFRSRATRRRASQRCPDGAAFFEHYRGLRCRSDWFFRRSVRHPHASVRIAVSRTTGMWIRSRLATRRFLATPAPAAKRGVSARSDSEVTAGP